MKNITKFEFRYHSNLENVDSMPDLKLEAKLRPAMHQQMMNNDLKRRYYQIYYNLLAVFYGKKVDNPFVPVPVMPNFLAVFVNYFFHSISLCKMRVVNPLLFCTSTNALNLSVSMFIDELETFFFTRELPIISLVDPNFQSNVKNFIKKSENLDVESVVTLFNEKYKIPFTHEQVMEITAVFQRFLDHYISWLRCSQLNDIALMEVAKQHHCDQGTIYAQKLDFLDFLMTMVKEHIVLKNQEMIKDHMRHLNEIRHFLKKPDFSTKNQTKELNEMINSMQEARQLFIDPFVSFGPLRRFKKSVIEEKIDNATEDKFSKKIKMPGLEALTQPVSDYFDAMREKSEFDELSFVYSRLMSHHEKLSAVNDHLKNLEKKNAVAFLRACKNGKLELVKKLYKFILEDTLIKSFYVACVNGHEKIVKYMANKISRDGRLIRIVLNHLDEKEDKTPLMIAANRGYTGIVDFL